MTVLFYLNFLKILSVSVSLSDSLFFTLSFIFPFPYQFISKTFDISLIYAFSFWIFGGTQTLFNWFHLILINFYIYFVLEMPSSFDRWEKDPFFSVAEEVQESADR